MYSDKTSYRRISVAVALVAAQLGLCVASVYAGETTNAVTISLSGSTAMRNFTNSASFTALTPGNTVTLHNGFTYHASAGDPANGIYTSVQLGANGNDMLPPPDSLTNASYRAFRAEWHEQGSVEGILEMANDQIAPINTLADRNPSVGNPVWVNGTLGGSLTAPGSVAGYTINASQYRTYQDFNLAGSNVQGGQNAVQMAISDVNARQGFSYTGGTAAWNRTPGQAGYGKGNSALATAGNTSGTGVARTRQQLVDQSTLNMTTDKVDPRTGANYNSGAWNNAGVDNLDNRAVAVTATTFAANPGTGLTHVNRTDAQFLQATGRLANGADFNVVTRDVNSGTRNVASLNVGLDPSFSVGENDGGNTGTGTPAESNAQANIGPSIRFSGKTAGGNALRPTVQNSRMAIGHLSISDIRSGSAAGTASNANAGVRPLRALAYRDDANDLADGSNGYGDAANGSYVKPSIDTITDGTYVLYQNETYVTVRTPDAVKYTDGTIKGDYTTNDVRQFRDNILNSAAQYPSASVSILNPANGLLATGFIPTKFMKVRKGLDGINQSTSNVYDASTNPTGTFDNSSQGQANFADVKSTAQSQFVVADAGSVTTGTGSTYGNVGSGITITNGNYLFGDFDNDGDRDFADVKLALSAQSALQASGNGVNFGTGTAATNNQSVSALTGSLSMMQGFDGTTGAKKGDLIVKGDFDSNGTFDGRDLYLLAHGAALAASTATDQLPTGANFGDSVRIGVLRKNAALDYMNANATDQQRGEASADGVVGTADDAMAFNKFDVNRDGVLNRVDAQIVDHFVGNNITDLGQQITATIGVDGTLTSGVAQRSFSLVDAELDDNLSITATLANGTSDFKLIRDADGLLGGDADFSGKVDFSDLLVLAQHFNQPADRWSLGDFNLDGTVSFTDLLTLAQNFNQSGGVVPSFNADFAADWALAQSLVPEPGTASLAIVTVALVRRRR